MTAQYLIFTLNFNSCVTELREKEVIQVFYSSRPIGHFKILPNNVCALFGPKLLLYDVRRGKSAHCFYLYSFKRETLV